MLSIQTNVNSLVAQQNLNVNNMFQSKTITQLTSGYRINESGDDAAGLAVANKFRNSEAELTQGVANGNDATAQLQIMDGGISNISQILDRLQTLATQSASGTFTGSRATLNQEFQTDLGEVDRQAQSIGLNTGGLFNTNLNVYLGEGSGSSALANGVVTLGLTASAVDSQALGLKGMQAIAGTVGTTDLGASSATSVATIVANTTNTGSELNTGHADFSFSGAGFSDANAVQVSVNLSGVSDTASLVTAINSAIVAAGTGGSPAGAAFAAAGIVASVNTDSSGKQQLAFTSSTSAFQVQAGDQMANALMGQFSDSLGTGTALSTTVTGTATVAGTTSFTPLTTGVTVQIQGGGMSSPVDLTLLKANDATVGAAILDLGTQVSSSAALQAAGISMSGGTGATPLVFTSASGEAINVMATGDTTNQLGLGALVAGASNAVTYATITGASTNTATAVSGQSTLQVSLNGAAATNLALNLTGGDATASSITTGAFAPGAAIVTGVSDQLNFSVDGIQVSTVLGANVGDAQAAATGGLFAAHAAVVLTAATNGAKAGAGAVTSFDFTNNPTTFGIKVDGQATAQTITLNGDYTTAAAYAGAIQGQLTGATVTSPGGLVTITSNTTGTNSSVQLIDGTATEAALVGSGGVTPTSFVVTKTLLVTTNDHVQATVTLSRADATAQDMVDDINYDNGGTNVGFHAALVNGNVAIVSDDAGKGAASTITLAAGTATLNLLGLTASTVHGDLAPLQYMNLTAGTGSGVAGNNQFMVSSDTHGPTLITAAAGTYDDGTSHTSIATYVNGLVSALGLSATLSAAGNLLITSTSAPSPGTSVSINAPPAVNGTVSSALGGGGLGLAAGTYQGGADTASTIAGQINTAITAALANGSANVAGDASATAVANANGTITITNNNAGADHTMSTFAADSSTVSFAGAAAVVAGTNRSGNDTASYLNGLFAASAALAPAQLTATWSNSGANPGTFTITSANGTNFRVNSGTTATASMTSSVTSLAAGVNFASGPPASNQAFQIAADDGVFKNIILSTTTTTPTGVAAALNAQFLAQSVNATATAAGNYVTLASNTVGAGAAIQIQNQSAADATAGYTNALAVGGILQGLTTGAVTSDQNLGFGVSGSSFTGAQATGLATTTAGTLNHMVDAGGASSLDITNPTTHVTSAVAFNALKYGNDSQAITITANNANGAQQSQTITLKNNSAVGSNTAGSNIDQAISYINAQLQQSDNPTLQSIVAVKENNGTGNQINFISSLAAFNVSVGSTANGAPATGDGVNAGVSNNYAVGVVGAGANMSIDTQAGAEAAVSAVATAVAKLGSAQAAVGIGENQLAYGINLAQSQITNEAAAESNIRDANVAQQAANLTKAQVLQQASIAAMAQANSAPQAVLALLRT